MVSLNEAFMDKLGLVAGGTYSAVFSDGRLIMGINASPIGDESGFGTVVFVVVEGL